MKKEYMSKTEKPIVIKQDQMEEVKKQESLKFKRTFVFGFCLNEHNKSYEEVLTKIGSFNTIDEFWSYYQHIRRPDQININVSFYLFQEPIKPMGEDKSNIGGGRFILRVKKKFSSIFGEDLILSFIGEQYPKTDNIYGLEVSIRIKGVIIYLGIKPAVDILEIQDIKKWIRKSLGLDELIDIEYRPHPKKQDDIPEAFSITNIDPIVENSKKNENFSGKNKNI